MTSIKRQPQNDDSYARPNRFAEQQGHYVPHERRQNKGEKPKVVGVRNRDTTVQGRMWRRKELTERQFMALDRFCEDWECGRLMSSAICRYEMGVDGGGGPAEWTDFQMAAREKYKRARNAIGSNRASLIEAIFFDGVPAADARMNDGFDYKSPPQQSARIKELIRIIADMLATHYRIG